MWCKPTVNKTVVGYYARLTAKTERLLQARGFRTVRRVKTGTLQHFLVIDLEIYDSQGALVALLGINAGLRGSLEDLDLCDEVIIDFVVNGLSESDYVEERFVEDRKTPENVIAFFHQFAFDLSSKCCGLATRFPEFFLFPSASQLFQSEFRLDSTFSSSWR